MSLQANLQVQNQTVSTPHGNPEMLNIGNNTGLRNFRFLIHMKTKPSSFVYSSPSIASTLMIKLDLIVYGIIFVQTEFDLDRIAYKISW